MLGVVNSDSTFQFALTGWAGTTCDGKVLRGALTKRFRLTPVKYYLSDVGYAFKSYCLTSLSRFSLSLKRVFKLKINTGISEFYH